MRAAARDRCGPAIVALCLALVVLIMPVQGITAEYRVVPNGTAYNARIELTDAVNYAFQETGTLGERVPFEASNISLEGDCSPCSYNLTGNSVQFPKGNYTISFQGPVRDNHLLFTFEKPYQVEVVLPAGLNVTNILLGFVSAGGKVATEGEETRISWNNTRSAELRFYDAGRENLLYLFANFWLIIAFIMLMPYLLTWRKRRG